MFFLLPSARVQVLSTHTAEAEQPLSFALPLLSLSLSCFLSLIEYFSVAVGKVIRRHELLLVCDAFIKQSPVNLAYNSPTHLHRHEQDEQQLVYACGHGIRAGQRHLDQRVLATLHGFFSHESERAGKSAKSQETRGTVQTQPPSPAAGLGRPFGECRVGAGGPIQLGERQRFEISTPRSTYLSGYSMRWDSKLSRSACRDLFHPVCG